MKFYKVRLKSNPVMTLEDCNSVSDLSKYFPDSIGRHWDSSKAAFKQISDMKRQTEKVLAARINMKDALTKSWLKRQKQLEDMEVVEYTVNPIPTTVEKV